MMYGNDNTGFHTTKSTSVTPTCEYDPFGRLLYTDPPPAYETAPQYLFSTKQYESHWQQYYYGYRYYSPDLGRWLNRDPIGETGGINLYVAARNNALLFVDSHGLFVVTAARVAALVSAYAVLDGLGIRDRGRDFAAELMAHHVIGCGMPFICAGGKWGGFMMSLDEIAGPLYDEIEAHATRVVAGQGSGGNYEQRVGNDRIKLKELRSMAITLNEPQYVRMYGRYKRYEKDCEIDYRLSVQWIDDGTLKPGTATALPNGSTIDDGTFKAVSDLIPTSRSFQIDISWTSRVRLSPRGFLLMS